MDRTGKYSEGIPLLKKAVELDPGFGLAFIYLYDASFFAERFDEMVKYRQKASELSGRISEKDRLLLESEFYNNCTDIDQRLSGRDEALAVWRSLGPRDLATALNVNERLWSLYPDFPEDTNGQLYLLDLCMELEDWDRAAPILDRLNLGGYKRPGIIQNIIECYRAMRIYDKAEKILADFVRENPDLDMPSERCALALDQGKFEEGLKYINVREPPAGKRNYSFFSQIGYVSWLRDDLEAAERIYATVVDPNNPAERMKRLHNLEVVAFSRGRIARGIELARQQLRLAKDVARGAKRDESVERIRHYDLAYLQRIAGNLPEALKEAEVACGGIEDRGIAATRELHLRAVILLEMGRLGDFDQRTEEIKSLIEKAGRPKFMRVYHHLLGLKEMKTGSAKNAIAHFERAQELVTPGRSFFIDSDTEPAKYFYSLAEAYELAGDKWANRWLIQRAYAKLSQITSKGSLSGDLYARSYYRMAKLMDSFFQGPGSSWDSYRVKAVENYRKFLQLWGGADSIFAAEVEDARKRLAALESR
jgi:tetratricopeptide (TPR) repeat protein